MGDEVKIVGLANPKGSGKTTWKVIGAIIGVLVLTVSVVAGILLVRQQQNIEEKAACTAACPNDDGQLVNCYQTADTDGEVSICNAKGRVEVCGSNSSNAKQYCCPSAGGNWTANLSACATVATPTATATAIATATVTASPTATASTTVTASPKATATTAATSGSKTAIPTNVAVVTPTDVPVPKTGASWPTIIGGSFGLVMILVSLALAL